jgi:hypothetical protein
MSHRARNTSSTTAPDSDDQCHVQATQNLITPEVPVQLQAWRYLVGLRAREAPICRQLTYQLGHIV